MTQTELSAFLAWLKETKEYELCRMSFGQYRLVRDNPAKLANEFLASRGPRPQEDVASESSPAEAPILRP